MGPAPEGEIQAEFVERLLAVGRWLEVNGEAIYGTAYGPLLELAFGKTTAKGDVLYVHVFDWPGASLEIAGLTGKVHEVTRLAGRKRLACEQVGGRIRIQTPAKAPDLHASVMALRPAG